MNACPECGYGEHLQHYRHAPNCSLIDLESAKHYLQAEQKWSELYRKRVSVFMNQAQRWEGKFRIVCHENNKLRAKLTANQPTL